MDEETQKVIQQETVAATVIQQKQSQDTKSKWARKQQLVYALSVLGILILLSIYPLFKLFYTPTSCFDNKQNQEEIGIDCGGSCSVLCGTQVEKLTIGWAKAFMVNKGRYDLAAVVENPNYNAGIKDMPYTFKVYDENGSIITEKTGSVFIKPRDKFIIFEPNIQTKGKEIKKVVLNFQQNPVWTKMQQQAPKITVRNKRLFNIKSSPRFNATIFNSSIDDLSNVDITAIVYNGSDNPIAVSSTYEERIDRGTSKDIFFTWPSKFTIRPNGAVCTAPADVVLAFDRSGSMGFAGQNPPQPLTFAKKAALEFINDMQPADKVGLVSFATFASDPVDQTLTPSQDKLKKAIESIKIDSPALEQHTNIGDAIEKAVKELSLNSSTEKTKKAIVLLTDGVASRPLNPKKETDKNYPEVYAISKSDEARSEDISLYVIGLGNEINEEFLSGRIATAPSYYYKAANSGELKKIYNDIARAVCKEEVFTTDVLVHINK
ncbi:MAG TPA: VWA domain-containing protein [Candidatus Yonathbacteria bacterium]|nr:VWA domain-containing protein [Candidatus Yonathbacteria bacterium]